MRSAEEKTVAGAAAVWLVGVRVLSAAENGTPKSIIQVDPWLMIYTLAVFVGLLIVLRAFAFKPILQGLQKREDFIRGSLAQARRERELAEKHRLDYEKKLADASEQARRIVHDSQERADAARMRIEQEAHGQADVLIERARREIAQARDTAVERMYEEVIELSSRLAQAALKRQMTPEEHQRLVLDSLRELGQQPRETRS